MFGLVGNSGTNPTDEGRLIVRLCTRCHVCQASGVARTNLVRELFGLLGWLPQICAQRLVCVRMQVLVSETCSRIMAYAQALCKHNWGSGWEKKLERGAEVIGGNGRGGAVIAPHPSPHARLKWLLPPPPRRVLCGCRAWSSARPHRRPRPVR